MSNDPSIGKTVRRWPRSAKWSAATMASSTSSGAHLEKLTALAGNYVRSVGVKVLNGRYELTHSVILSVDADGNGRAAPTSGCTQSV